MKKLLICISFLLLIAGLSSTLSAQPQYYNYNTNGSNNSFPLGIAAGKEVQLLFLPGEFNQPTAAPSGNIISVSFRVGDTYPINNFIYNTFTVKMGQSTITSFAAGVFYTGTLTTVYSRASVTLNAAGGTWLTLTLDTPFPYNNTQSLIIDFGHCSSTNATGFPACFTNMATTRRNWSVGGCPFVYGGQNTSIYHTGINVTTGPTGTLQGTVTNSVSGLPISGASVTVNAMTPVFTDGVGFYQKTLVPNGTATINATAAGYLPYSGTAVIAGGTTVKNFTMTPVPALLTGIITNASTGAPILGARVSVGATFGYTIWDGSYSFYASPSGLQPVIVQKPGFITSNVPVNIVSPSTTYSVALQVSANPPGTVTATLNTGATAVDISWLPPSGSYEIIYDDGTQNNFTVWAAAGNMNAVKFTPVTGGALVTAGKVHIGDKAAPFLNYPPATDPTTLAPFQIAVYDATGPGGTPGAQIGAPIDVQPANFGWNLFTFPTPIAVTGNFFLVMIQGGTPPTAAGLAIDETTNKLRSYSRFVTGAGPWLPASGNYMIRAVVTGQGGPLDTDVLDPKTEITANAIEGLIYDHTPATVTGVEGDADYVPTVIPYTVWRLLEGQEAPASEPLWGAPIASNITATSTVDNGWPSLPDGPYRWAVKAGYPVNRMSLATFSNVIGKNWTAAVTVNVDLTCDVSALAGAVVKLQNQNFSQYMYTATTTSTGTVTFPAVWKGTYTLTVSLIGYDLYSSPNNLIMGPMTFDVVLLQQKLGPSKPYVGNKTLIMNWFAPVGLDYPLFEDWASGNFATNGWTSQANWTVTTYNGNPSPCAEFPYYPTMTNYSRSLTSKMLTGTGSPDFKLLYDIYYSDWGGSLEELAVEYQVGGAGPWILLKHYDNTGGSIPWTTETINMASASSQTFQIRFRAYGVNSYNINNWDIDNIKVRSIAPDPKPCILAYNVYLNNVLEGVTTDTNYQIAPSHVTYGSVYQACVLAVYGSGYSAKACTTFTSKYLYPPKNLQVEAVECSAYLTWEKPGAKKKVHLPAFQGTVANTPPSFGPAPVNQSQIDPGDQVYNGIRGSQAFGINASVNQTINFDVDNLPGMVNVAPTPAGFWMDVEFPVDQPDWAYAIINGSDHLYKVIRATGAFTDLGSLGSGTADQILDIAVDPTDGGIYAVSTNASLTADKLWKINPAVPSATLISGATGSAGMIGLACDGAGNMWGHDIVTDNFWSVNKTTGIATIVGSLGFNANFGQGMFYDETADAIMMNAYNSTAGRCEIRTVDVATGASTINGAGASWSTSQIGCASLPVSSASSGGAGLLGYNIYRDSQFLDYVGDPDTLFYYDFTVEPGTHTYEVSAWYDLSFYITPPPLFDESMLEGPVEIDIMCGRELPFYEPWDQGSFAYQNWTVDPVSATNWSINSGVGNPIPAADFSWVPIQYDYTDRSIETPVLNAGPFTCAMIWCDFDYKLVDRNSTGAEKLYMDVFYKGAWKNKAEFSNTASKDWTPMHVDISGAGGKAFKVRFRAEGVNSADILHWYVDNVHIYAKCNPPVELDHSIMDKEVTLTWSQPICPSDGPDPVWIHWDDGTNADAIGTGGAANFDCAARWDASQIVALDGGSVTKISFYPASTGSGNFKIRVWQGPDAATLLVDQAVPTVTWDDFNIVDVASPVPIDITQELWIGYNIDATGGWPAGVDPGPAVVGYGDMIYFGGVWASMYTAYGLDYNWNIAGYVETVDDHAMMNKAVVPLVKTDNYKSAGTLSSSGLPSLNTRKFNYYEDAADVRALLGYNIYRSDDFRVTYNKLNATMLTDTNYVDVVPNYQEYYYYVTSIFPTYEAKTCESDSSNVIMADVITGMDQLNGGRISIYPNPATENVFVKSDYTITNIEVLNYIGQTVYSKQNVSEKTVKVNVANLTIGVYFVKVTTLEGIKTVKITVTK